MVVLRQRHFINLHKATTPFVILALMTYFENFSIGPYIYFGLHSGYCICWLIKEIIFPDSNFNKEMSFLKFIGAYLALMTYWVAPYVLISSGIVPQPLTLFMSIPVCLIGFLFHFGADSQKYFTLQHKKGLITTGFFSRTRNPNYFGEFLMYMGWSILAESLVPIGVLLTVVATLFYPRMLSKDKSISRHPGFAEYLKRTNFFFPKIF